MLIARQFIIKENIKIFFPLSNFRIVKSNLRALPSIQGFIFSKYKC